MRHFLFFVFLFCLQQVYSQSVFNPGYIISNQNDTTFGLIENNSFVENAKYCVFKKSDNSEIIRYAPTEIKAYRFTNGKYYSSEIIYETPIFLEYLVKGNLNLFYNRDELGNNYFFVSKNNLPLTELYTSKRLVENNENFSVNSSTFAGTDTVFTEVSDDYESKARDQIFQNKKFVGILKYFTENNPKLINSINSAELSQTSLIGIVKKYNELTEVAGKNNSFSKKYKHNILVQVGGGLSVFNVIKHNGVYDYKSIFGANPQETSSPNIQRINRQTYGAQVLLQQSKSNENLYLGIGFFYNGMLTENTPFYRVPLSINYISQKMGLSPTFSYQFDLNKYAMYQKAELGLIYRFKKLSLNLTAGAYTKTFVNIYGFGSQLSLGYTL
jgi:hypothetical protein